MRLRRGLQAKILTGTILAALVGVGATGWLVTAATSRQLRGQLARSLDTDNSIYRDIADFASTHPSWAGIEQVIGPLARDTGQRIALTTEKGRLIADSDKILNLPRRPMPPRPVAVVNAADSELARTLPAESSSIGVLTPGETFSTQEITVRTSIAQAGIDCMRQHGIDASLDANDGLPPTIAYDDTIRTNQVTYYTCVDTDALNAPSKAAVTAAATAVNQQADCLTKASVRFSRSVVLGLPSLTIDPGQPADAGAGCSGVLSNVKQAPPAQLYLGVGAELTLGQVSWWQVGLVGAAVLVPIIILALWAARRIARPVRDLTAAAQLVANGDLSPRVTARSNDEISQLGTAFNTMADTLAHNESARQRMTADVAHELRNPLVALGGTLEAIEDGIYSPTPDVIAGLSADVAHLQAIVDDLADLAAADSGQLRLHVESCDLVELAREVCDTYTATARRRNIDVFVQWQHSAIIDADPARVRQMLGNLLSNALRHSRTGGSIIVDVQSTPSTGRLTVTDFGDGIPADELAHIFDRFYSADPARNRNTSGTGLGLAITKQLVDLHHGQITVTSTQGAGSSFTIELPSITA